MPEIGEVARIVHYLKKHIVGRTIASVKTQEDEIVYGKADTTAQAFEVAMQGKKIVDARQQGKYFWLVMSSPPHPLMHFGMTGWMKLSNEDTAYYKPAKPEPNSWPPRFWKFSLQMEGEPDCEAAFVDARRLGRIRLIDVEADKIRDTEPLRKNGPDPVVDKDVLTLEWMKEKVKKRKLPIKALLLDQANISGIGNWVADEILYQARIHPEQYSNSLSDVQLAELHKSIIQVCTTAVNILAQPEDIPTDWLVKHRWSKSKKGSSKLPNGDKIVFLTVGGRTSAVVPNVQKKTGPVSADVSADIDPGLKDRSSASDPEHSAGSKKRTASAKAATSEPSSRKKQRSNSYKESRPEEDKLDPVHDTSKDDQKAPSTKKSNSAKHPSKKPPDQLKSTSLPGNSRRRSARLRQ